MAWPLLMAAMLGCVRAGFDSNRCAGAVDCDDQNPCTEDLCGSDNRCQHPSTTGGCDDQQPCTHSDICVDGSCQGTTYTCDDGDVCTDDICNGDNSCSFPFNTAPCDDQDSCTSTSSCNAGSCSGTVDKDSDGDTFIDAGCSGGDDCDDGDPLSYPGAGERCDGNDNSCAGSVPGDEIDGEPDGWVACSGWSDSQQDNPAVLGGGDCDDTNAVANPAQVEGPPADASCSDGHDNDCDGDSDGADQACVVLPGEPTFVALTAGDRHTCGITGDGAAFCWGDDSSGQLGNGNIAGSSQVAVAVETRGMSGDATFAHITAGTSHTCGVAGDGLVYCWGQDLAGQLGRGATTGDTTRPEPVDTSSLGGITAFRAVAAGGSHSCGLISDGRIFCWGDDSAGQLGDGTTTTGGSVRPVLIDTTGVNGEGRFVAVHAGTQHSCAVTAEGDPYCWGSNSIGQLGSGGGDSVVPVAVDTGALVGSTRFVSVSAGDTHSCGRAADGVIYCWGDDSYGQIGYGGTWTSTPTPVAVNNSTVGGRPFLSVSAGADHTCGLQAGGTAACWGRDQAGQLGNASPSMDTSNIPLVVDATSVTTAQTFKQVVAGRDHGCGLAVDGLVHCWGEDTDGQAGTESGTLRHHTLVPLDTRWVPNNQGFLAVVTRGVSDSCGLRANGKAYCWGNDTFGKLGAGIGDNSSGAPVAVDLAPLGSDPWFVEISNGGSHSCGLTGQGLVYCWGSDTRGGLGDGGGDSDAESPVSVELGLVSGDTAFAQISAGGNSCGVTAQGVAYCWGSDTYGQLGDGGGSADTQRPGPVEIGGVGSDTRWLQVASGLNFVCGITAQGRGYCWGDDVSGQLGDGSGDSTSQVPLAADTTNLGGVSRFLTIDAGSTHACGISSAGVAVCWGADQYGQLGDAVAVPDAASPQPVSTTGLAGDAAWRRIAASGQHSCGITVGGAAYCWGRDSHGQGGNGGVANDVDAPVGVDVSPLGPSQVFGAIAVGNTHSCGITGDGATYCWGNDDDGELGDGGIGGTSQSPVLVDRTGL